MRGRTPLHFAAVKGKNKDTLDDEGLTPLLIAAVYPCRVAATLNLLKTGADVHIRRAGLSVVHMAAAQPGQVEILRVAIEHGADVNATGPYQCTALHVAALQNVGAIDVLMGARANIEARAAYDIAPLHVAAGGFCLVAVTALLRHGADVDARDDIGETPLHKAARRMAGAGTAAEMVDFLLRTGADETIVGEHGAAASLVGYVVKEEDGLAEDVNRVRKLLANAPGDRAWRRRGYLVLCCGYPDTVQLGEDSTGKCGGVARRTRSRATRERAGRSSGCHEAVGGMPSTVKERAGDNWAAVVVRLLELQEEGVFRAIVEYL